jgi:hypothetical protein
MFGVDLGVMACFDGGEARTTAPGWPSWSAPEQKKGEGAPMRFVEGLAVLGAKA